MFYKLDEIHSKHKEFVQGLEKEISISGDEQRIGNSFKLMASGSLNRIYEEYVNNYPVAVGLIHRYMEDENVRPLLQQIMEPFHPETNRLEEILLKPVQRMQRNTLVLHDLLKYTPEDHPDYIELQKALKLSEENLRSFNINLGALSCKNPKRDRHLAKSGFVVEVVKKVTRQLRYLFLFNDILICTKQKRSNRTGEVNYKLLWSMQLLNIKIEIPETTFSCKDSTDDMKAKIGTLKAEMKEEMKKESEAKDKTFSITGRRAAKMVEKLKKKIQEQEAMLVEALPHLPLKLEDHHSQGTGQSHLLLFPTEYEREEWRESLDAQQQRNICGQHSQLSTHELEALINNNKQHTVVNSIGYKLLEKDEEVLNGILNVTIHRLYGLESPCDTYCCLEMDSYGHFYKKAQTHVCHGSSSIPSWDEDFELDLDASQSLRILCFKKGLDGEKDVILGKCALELSMDWLKCEFHEKTVTMNEVSLTVSIRHTPASKTLKRTPSKVSTGIFGVKIASVTRRERKTTPTIVIACTQEITKRGLDEVGIYRVSGVTSEVQRLKRLFNKNPVAAGMQIGDVDIHAVTGVLKLYFRELPEPLFTDANYHQFLHLVELSDEEAKEKCMLELLHSLPEPNYYTIVHMIEHLVGVAKMEKENKMSLNNLATIFGPTLLHPAVRESAMISMDQIASVTQQAILQAEVLLYFLKLVALGRNIRKSAVLTKM
ncbi:hypothetical protein ACJMK2_011013 [Sinanodonta woodiana]|uniref:Active breakpoint cluster region-related protein n=1 Tax=Sinanodonta woodiana TaxID=1069815 RepID=A0ABD3V3I8_SINWO